MLAAAEQGHLDICKWLFEYGGDAKYQINKEICGHSPLTKTYEAWCFSSDKEATLSCQYGRDDEGKTCRWLLQNGGGQYLSTKTLRHLGTERDDKNSNILVLWMREYMQLHDTFILFLCAAATMNATTSESESSDSTRRKRKFDSYPGIMELIGDYVGLIRGKEIRMLKEFNELVIEYTINLGSDDDYVDY